jgi:hypothetical protein
VDRENVIRASIHAAAATATRNLRQIPRLASI